MSTETLVLASASPRRRELLAQIGVPVRVLPGSVDEQVLPGELPLVYVERVTRAKLADGLARAGQGAVVLAADTSVVLDQQVLGKPADAADARRMLRALSGRNHQVITCVAVGQGTRSECRTVVSEVGLVPLDEARIEAYWATGEPQDKAGAYAIQGLGAVFVSQLAGSYSAVVGLPLRETAELLAVFGIACWQSPSA